MNKDFHKKGFDKSTRTKLDIFDKYFNEAFPVFVHSKGMEEIYICDFFAGKGMDIDGEYGTSLNILESISSYCEKIAEKGKKVVLILNDKDEFESLKKNVETFMVNCKNECKMSGNCILKLESNLFIRDKDFSKYFDQVYSNLVKKPYCPKILFIDPFGLAIGNEIFHKLIDLPKTDFICFIPSSFLRRFKEFKRFNDYINLKEIDFINSLPNNCHRVISDYFEYLIPDDKDYFLCHFSIKKGSNYYGLLYGTNHSLGAEKFLKICWSIDQLTGEADYNIDSEPSYKEKTLFEELNIPSKIKNFKMDLENLIMEKQILTNYDAYIFGLKRKCIPRHVTEILKDLIERKVIGKIKTINNDIHKLNKEQIIIIKNGTI